MDNLLELLEKPSRGEPLEEKTPENLPDSSLLSLICTYISRKVKINKLSENVIHSKFRQSALLCNKMQRTIS
jgi:hypothetical protein